jgi:hypothetical protein
MYHGKTMLGDGIAKLWIGPALGDCEWRSRETDMPLNEKNDPEMSYRRGYQDGAPEMLGAVERFLDPATRDIVLAWIEQDINGRRLKAMLVHAPTWRLNELNALKEGGPAPAS